MHYKKKMKLEKALYGLLMLLCFAVVGGFAGYFIVICSDTLQKFFGTSREWIMVTISVTIAMLLIFASYFLNIFLHEIGHLIFGLLSGYRFCSIRFGNRMLTKEDGKLRWFRYDMPGTAGQCIMIAPEVEAEHMPVLLYNLGGLIVNLGLFFLSLLLFLVLKGSHLILAALFLISGLTSMILFITNGAPFTQTGTDGANAIILHRDVNAREAFKKQLDIVYYLSIGRSSLELPKELFSFDPSVPLTSPLLTAQAINAFEDLFSRKQFSEAKDLALFILEHTQSINTLHESLLYGELLFIDSVIEKDLSAAKELFAAHRKELNSAAGFISVQRDLFAYYKLVEPDEKKAASFEKAFQRSLKNYPYPQDKEQEVQLFDLIIRSLEETTSIGSV